MRAAFLVVATAFSLELAVCASWPQLLPQPSALTVGGSTLSLSSANFSFSVSGGPSPRLSRAFARYSALLFLQAQPAGGPPVLPPPSAALTGVLVTLGAPDSGAPPQLHDSEAYTLTLPAGGGVGSLRADTVFGALRGLETLAQLAWFDGAAFSAVAASVTDAPRFAWRGALIDTARHFLPLPALYACIDALAAAKMNVFHWHIVDDQSFPYVSAAFPALSAAGAWAAPATTHTYARADVAAVIAYASDRGVRVVAELDTPGHSLSWGKGQPGLLTPCYNSSGPDGSFGPIDPTQESTFAFLATLFGEVAATFPDAHFHVGGDEVDFACWQSSPLIAAWMSAHGMAGNFTMLESYYVQRVLDLVQSLGKTPVGWQEIFDNRLNLTVDTIVTAWKNPFASTGQAELARITAAGHPTLLASGWYENYIAYGSQWPSYYAIDPQNFTGSDAQRSLVLGGEWSLWAEFVDSTNFISRAWPTAAAIAERLWSPASVRSVADATVRMQAFACRLVARGIPAEPANGPSFCPTEYAFTSSPPT